MDTDQFEEFDKDHSTIIQDLSKTSPRSQHNDSFTYNMDDIDHVSDTLGIPWEKSKDVQFSTEINYIGFRWSIPNRTVAITEEKRQKYLSAVGTWLSSRTHTLEEAQKLHGKLLHITLIIPQGRPRLTTLESFLGIFGSKPFLPCTPPQLLHDDIVWWQNSLTNTNIQCPIPGPTTVIDLQAYSDASSEVGISVEAAMGEGDKHSDRR
jgi:hypothetical protein